MFELIKFFHISIQCRIVHNTHFRALFELRFLCNYSICSNSTSDIVGRDFVVTLGKARKTGENEKIEKVMLWPLFRASYGRKVGLHIFIDPF